MKQFTLEKILLGLALTLIVLSFFGYMYCINKTVVFVVEREELSEELSTVGARVSELEFSYIHLKNEITADRAYAIGFAEIDTPTFISKKTAVSLSSR